jgi:hypothetical protein
MKHSLASPPSNAQHHSCRFVPQFCCANGSFVILFPFPNFPLACRKGRGNFNYPTSVLSKRRPIGGLMIELHGRHTFSDSARLQRFYRRTWLLAWAPWHYYSRVQRHKLSPSYAYEYSTLLPYHMAASREPGLLQGFDHFSPVALVECWCGREDLNLHTFWVHAPQACASANSATTACPSVARTSFHLAPSS